MSDLLTLNDAAEYLGVSRMKLWRLMKEGKLTAVINELDNREKLISKMELDALKSKAPKNDRQQNLNPLAA
jgi:excisionase family DNA binding protein